MERQSASEPGREVGNRASANRVDREVVGEP